MDKKSLLAVVLVMLVIMFTMVYQANRYSGNQDTVSTESAEVTVQDNSASAEENVSAEAQQVVEEEKGITAVSAQKSSEKFFFETDFYQIEFDPAGASIASLMLKNHKAADGEQIDMIFKGENGHNAFLLYWGDDYKNPILDVFSYTVEGQKVIFSN